MIPFIFGALGLAVGAVAGAFTTHAVGESDRQAAKHHREIANELTDKYTNLERKYHELAESSQKQIIDLTRQHALDEVEKDCLRLVVRLQQNLIYLMCDIDRYPTEAALKEFLKAVELTNNVLCRINEELIFVPSDYYARNQTAAFQREFASKQVAFLKSSSITGEVTPEENCFIETNQEEYTNMPSHEFQETYNKILSTGKNLLEFLQENRASRLEEGDKTQGIQSVEDDIRRALSALAEQKFQVAVIAAMKAGKSTFLNSIIGADVLASESEACTVCRTDIRPIKAGQTPRLLEYREGQREPVVLIEGETGEIRQTFLKRTHEIRETQNADDTIRFELQHPIEAINNIPSLAGFTLVDTPGPNEWESASFNTVALKQTALEALRTCDAILFILDYTSFKDNTNSELLKDLIEQRQEFLSRSKEKIFFILNKVDRKAEKDRPIEYVIKDLSITLSDFGIPEPIIYPASAWQGLLAKLIKSKTATQEHKADFKNFFLARYIEEDEDGEVIVPKLSDIVPTALDDSGISKIENVVIQAVVRNSGWNLLSDVLATFNKAAQAIHETFITEIKGWEVEYEELEKTIEEYKQRSNLASNKVANVKKSVEEQKRKLISRFSQGIHEFAESAKKRIEKEIDTVAQNKSKQSVSQNQDKNLLTFLQNAVTSFFTAPSSSNPYLIRVQNRQEAEKIQKTVNQYCTPVIQSFWLDTQDTLVREGASIREGIVQKIQKEIQAISNELSEYLGNALEVEINSNPVQFPKFEFPGIDAKIKQQQEVFTRTKRETRRESRCCASDKVYEVNVPYQETISYYEIDLRQTCQAIKQNIDLQVQNNIQLLERVIEKQVSEDFRKGERQINDYINRFQDKFDYLLKERAIREVEAPDIIENLQNQSVIVKQYWDELEFIRQILDSWKPMSTSINS